MITGTWYDRVVAATGINLFISRVYTAGDILGDVPGYVRAGDILGDVPGYVRAGDILGDVPGYE